jgi:hypothetical protein
MSVIWYTATRKVPVSYGGLAPHNNDARAGHTPGGPPELANKPVFIWHVTCARPVTLVVRLSYHSKHGAAEWRANPTNFHISLPF